MPVDPLAQSEITGRARSRVPVLAADPLQIAGSRPLKDRKPGVRWRSLTGF